MSLNASARTHAGRVRPQNEDAAVCRPEHGLFAVIDGMGGQEAGEVAAAIAAAALSEVPNVPGLASETVLVAAMKEARTRILHQADKQVDQRDMGAVATAARIEDNGRSVAIAHVGDTRAWLVNRKGVRQLTTDHVAEGAGKRPVARDLGRRTMDGEWVETNRFPVGRGDLLVLASDGLHDPVPADELAAELQRLWREGADADAVTSRLVALALARGGPDNVTVVATRISPFRRGQSRRRLSPVLTVALLAVLIALVVSSLYGRTPSPVLELPDRVSAQTLFTSPATVTAEAGKVTTVADGGSLLLRGVRVTGVDWRVEVGAGAQLTIDLTAFDLTGAFTVLLAKGASLHVVDSRVSAGAIRVVSEEGSTVSLNHVSLTTLGGPGPSFEGPAVPTETDVRRSGVLEEPAAPPEPAAPEVAPEAPKPTP